MTCSSSAWWTIAAEVERRRPGLKPRAARCTRRRRMTSPSSGASCATAREDSTRRPCSSKVRRRTRPARLTFRDRATARSPDLNISLAPRVPGPRSDPRVSRVRTDPIPSSLTRPFSFPSSIFRFHRDVQRHARPSRAPRSPPLLALPGADCVRARPEPFGPLPGGASGRRRGAPSHAHLPRLVPRLRRALHGDRLGAVHVRGRPRVRALRRDARALRRVHATGCRRPPRPFVDAEHKTIRGEDDSHPLEASFEEVFAFGVRDRLEKFWDASADAGYAPSVVLMPSTRDATHDAVFPQPPPSPTGRWRRPRASSSRARPTPGRSP